VPVLERHKERPAATSRALGDESDGSDWWPPTTRRPTPDDSSPTVEDIGASPQTAIASRSRKRGARGDPVWVALLSGVQSVRLGLKDNDPRATRVGIDVVRTQCARLG